MKTFLVIGIGRFGRHLSIKLAEMGNEVLSIDKHEEAVSELVPYVTKTVIGDCTKVGVLESLDVPEFDVCFVCIGTNFQSSLEVSAMLKDLGAKKVVSKASTEIQKKFLLRNGADEVVYPEKDVAEDIAMRFNADNLLRFFELSHGVVVVEVMPLTHWIGKSIKEMDFRARYQANILATRVNDEAVPLPDAEYVFKEDEAVMLMGREEDINKMLKNKR